MLGDVPHGGSGGDLDCRRFGYGGRRGSLLRLGRRSAAAAAAPAPLLRRRGRRLAARRLRVDHDAAPARRRAGGPLSCAGEWPALAVAGDRRRGCSACRLRAGVGRWLRLGAAGSSLTRPSAGCLAVRASALRRCPAAVRRVFATLGFVDARRGCLDVDARRLQCGQQVLAGDTALLRHLVDALLRHRARLTAAPRSTRARWPLPRQLPRPPARPRPRLPRPVPARPPRLRPPARTSAARRLQRRFPPGSGSSASCSGSSGPGSSALGLLRLRVLLLGQRLVRRAARSSASPAARRSGNASRAQHGMAAARHVLLLLEAELLLLLGELASRT